MNDQRSVTDQLATLIQLAHKHGLYDAADWVRSRIEADQAQLAKMKERQALLSRKTVTSSDSLQMIVNNMNPRQQKLLARLSTDWETMHMAIHERDLRYFESLGLVELREVPAKMPGMTVTEGRRTYNTLIGGLK